MSPERKISGNFWGSGNSKLKQIYFKLFTTMKKKTNYCLGVRT